MPTGGVASHFVHLLDADQRTCRRRAVVMGIVTLLLAVLAHILYPDNFLGLLVHALAVLVGLLAGQLFTRRRVTAYEASLRGTWKSWMRFSVAAESVPELYRRVQGKGIRNLPWLAAAGLTLLWVLEVALLLLAFQDTDPSAWAFPSIALNGLLPAFLLVHYARLGSWMRGFAASVSDLVDSGEIGVWGVL
ncbi:MAG TPA: hypothetical protein VM327_03410 [Candidatus Thermoplasmatota archaeon]|nr:hypothetical protein [Candidatus Thermoplasmatota archaeon]